MIIRSKSGTEEKTNVILMDNKWQKLPEKVRRQEYLNCDVS